MNDAERAYLEEQNRLQAESDGEAPDDLRLEVPKDPEVDPRVYRDVEALLYRGFIFLPAEINDVDFVFKSLNQHEFDIIQMTLGYKSGDAAGMRRFYNLFLAYGVLMVDGHSILADREKWIPDITKLFDGLSQPARAKVIRNMSEVNRRAAAAVTLTEAYAMETSSRFRWSQLRGLDLSSPAFTGMRGTDYLGLNWAQLTWRALNAYEDMKDIAEREWENAKFIGACFAGKGLSKVYSHDTRRRREEADARRSRKDHILRHVILGAPLDDGVERKGDQVIIAAKTVDQLADQLSKSLKGEKDWHDEVVSAIEERVQREQRESQERLEKLAEENAQIYGQRGVVGATDITGLTREDVAKRLEARQLAAASQIRPELTDQRHSEFLDRWHLSGKEPPTAPTTQRENVKPFKR
jgi:hypothetical protein